MEETKERDEGRAVLGVEMTPAAFRPKKKLGQHFLTRQELIRKIIRLSRFDRSDILMEIGPGMGALTLPLALKVAHIFAVEKDPELFRLLGEKISQAGLSNVTLINEDILKFSMAAVVPSDRSKIQVIGNLPYNISSPFLQKLVDHRSSIGRAILMFQRELALRICAAEGGKPYGAMTLLVRYHARATSMLHVPKEAFYPRPKVDSTVVELDFQRPYPGRIGSEAAFARVVKGAFAHRRKTLVNSLQLSFPFLDRETILHGLKACTVDPRRRPENLTMDEYLCIADKLSLTTCMDDVKRFRFD